MELLHQDLERTTHSEQPENLAKTKSEVEVISLSLYFVRSWASGLWEILKHRHCYGSQPTEQDALCPEIRMAWKGKNKHSSLLISPPERPGQEYEKSGGCVPYVDWCLITACLYIIKLLCCSKGLRLSVKTSCQTGIWALW